MKKSLKFILLLSIIITGCEDNDCVMNDFSQFARNGCGDFMVYVETNETGNSNSFLIIEVDRPELGLNNKFTSFNIQNNKNISANIYEYNHTQWTPYCAEAVFPMLELLKSWNLKSGIAEIRIVKEKSECDETYVVDLILKEAIFTDNEMNEIYIEEKKFNNIIVNYSLSGSNW